MNNLTNIRWTIHNNLVSLRAECEGPYKGIWFVILNKELDDFTTPTLGITMHDIGHHMHICGDTCTFYDFSIPSKATGTMEIPYVSVNIPLFVRKVLTRYARLVQKGLSDSDRVEVTLSHERIARWKKLYGIGKGSVDVELASYYGDEDVAATLEERKKKGNFTEMLGRLEQIERNQTYAFFQKRTLRIAKDWDGYTFVSGGLFGGLVNHGTEEEPNWSIHT